MVDEEMDKNECYEHGDNESHESFQRLVRVHDPMTSHSDSKEGGVGVSEAENDGAKHANDLNVVLLSFQAIHQPVGDGTSEQ